MRYHNKRDASGRSSSVLAIAVVFTLLVHGPLRAEEQRVGITPSLESVEILHGDQELPVVIRRNPDTANTINPVYAKTSRPCPPFCILPMKIPHGVETIGELELIGYLERISRGDETVVVIDSRTEEWTVRGTIPGSINIPWQNLSPKFYSEEDIAWTLEDFGARKSGELWDFAAAKTLALFCNGSWCGQSMTNIRGLLRMGYPAHKLKWYRGGMQAWEALGLTTVLPE